MSIGVDSKISVTSNAYFATNDPVWAARLTNKRSAS
jgi:hypothetical protein